MVGKICFVTDCNPCRITPPYRLKSTGKNTQQRLHFSYPNAFVAFHVGELMKMV